MLTPILFCIFRGPRSRTSVSRRQIYRWTRKGKHSVGKQRNKHLLS